jgi:phosphoribosylformimino-5-aminoimidazole carboxamide ribonucleotide (ProFAR) isomerase
LAAAPGIAGAIVGRALYDGRVDLAQALAALAAENAEAGAC